MLTDAAGAVEIEVPRDREDTITRITDTVLEEMAAWWPGPRERVYAAIFIDVIARQGS